MVIFLDAQVQTEVPPVVPGAKPVTVEHIKIHGTALEGNLEQLRVDIQPFDREMLFQIFDMVACAAGHIQEADAWLDRNARQKIQSAFLHIGRKVTVVPRHPGGFQTVFQSLHFGSQGTRRIRLGVICFQYIIHFYLHR